MDEVQMSTEPPSAVLGLAEGLGAAKHLDRERALARFNVLLQATGTDGEALLPALCDIVGGLLQGEGWEPKMGGLMSGKALVEAVGARLPDAFATRLVVDCQRLLEDEEPRVRLAVAACLRALAQRGGAEVYVLCRDRVLASIDEHFDREGEGRRANGADGSGASSPASSVSSHSSVDLISALLHSSYQPRRPGKGDMRHGTEGWKCLETSMRAFQALVEGCGEGIRPHITQEVLDLLYRALQHPNRFVRETGFLTLCSVCEALKGAQLASIGLQIAKRLADGLTDNWSQVRYAACTGARAFMLCVGTEHVEAFMALMLGPLCLNRHYVAEGVRQYSIETWRLVTAGQGPQRLAQFIDPVVDYYVAQTKATHLSVREAACTCAAELCERVDRAAVTPRVPHLLRALVACGRDTAWPVRDAACVALGRVVVCYLDLMSADTWLEASLTLWLTHVKDSVPTLRDNCAVALANAARVAGAPVTLRVLAAIRSMLPMAHQQPSDSAAQGAAAPEVSYDPEDRDSAMFSPALLARFGNQHLVKADGCTDFGAARDPEPWEAADGAVRMLREIATVSPDCVPEFLPLLADVARVNAFPNAPNLRETVWQCLPAIAKGTGKKQFKSHLEPFLPPLFSDLGSSSHQLAQAAAGVCAAALRDFIGPSIFLGRLDDDQRELLLRSPHVPAAAGGYPGPGAARGYPGPVIAGAYPGPGTGLRC